MGSKKILISSTLFSVLAALSMTLILSYGRLDASVDTHRKDAEARNNDKKHQKDKVGILADSNAPFPCWNQSWDCGDWHPLDYQPKRDSYFITTVADKTMAESCCDNCSSFRLINMESETERIILSDEGKIKSCKHHWEASTHAWSLELIGAGDMLVIVYRGHMYMIRIEEIRFFQDRVYYKNAEIPSPKFLSTKIDLNQLKWYKKIAEDKIQFADRDISISTHEFNLGEDKKPIGVLSIWYDYYYGGPPSWANIATAGAPAHMAIIHKEYLDQRSVVDLRKFRFKTWEDGLGNRCNED